SQRPSGAADRDDRGPGIGGGDPDAAVVERIDGGRRRQAPQEKAQRRNCDQGDQQQERQADGHRGSGQDGDEWAASAQEYTGDDAGGESGQDEKSEEQHGGLRLVDEGGGEGVAQQLGLGLAHAELGLQDTDRRGSAMLETVGSVDPAGALEQVLGYAGYGRRTRRTRVRRYGRV